MAYTTDAKLAQAARGFDTTMTSAGSTLGPDRSEVAFFPHAAMTTDALIERLRALCAGVTDLADRTLGCEAPTPGNSAADGTWAASGDAAHITSLLSDCHSIVGRVEREFARLADGLV